MATYDGLYLRSNLGETNIVPKGGNQLGSPDIIPYGTQPPANPSEQFKDYGVDYGKNLTLGQPNFIYLRSKNYAADKITSTPRLFYVTSSIISKPSAWREIIDVIPNPVRPTISAEAGAVGLVDKPFVWIPDDSNPSEHYCLVGMVKSPGCKNPEEVLNAITVTNLAKVLSENGGLAWRNINTVSNNMFNYTKTMEYDQMDEGHEMYVNIVCKNVPVGVQVSFSARDAGPDPSFFLDWTTVSTFPSFMTGIKTSIPAHWKSTVYMNLRAAPGTNLDNADLSIQATYITSPGSPLFKYGLTLSELGVPHPDIAKNNILRQLYNDKQPLILQPHHEQYLEQLVTLWAKIGPQRMIVLGENSVEWRKGA